MTNATEEPGVIMVDNAHAPDVFADEALGYFLLDGVLRIAFGSVRPVNPAPGDIQRVMIGRLVMPLPAAQRLALGLYDFLKQRGFDPADLVKGDATPQ